MMKLDLSTAWQIIDKVKERQLELDERIDLAIELSKCILSTANTIQSREEYQQMAQLDRMMRDPEGKVFTSSMTDECFRSNSCKRIANQITHLISKHGTPKYLGFFNRLQMNVFQYLGESCAGILIPMVKEIIRRETARVILPGEDTVLKKHLLTRQEQGITTNLNHLGEAILGEAEAERRLQTYLSDLQKPEIEYISVKISTLFSQINLISYQQTLTTIKDKLRLLYRASIKNALAGDQGKPKAKFINLDMEEYRDLHLTIDAFQQVLSEEEFLSYRAGIVLQAYLPDSYDALKDLTQWARQRHAASGSSIKVRLVKGANLAMEKIDSSLNNWPQAPFSSKVEVDAHYRKMVHFALQKDNAVAVNIGIASHNIFDISYAMLLKYEQDVSNYVNFEMLEGMAEHLRAVVQQLSQGIILYCPTANKEEFQNAIAYLIRRLDENTAPDNFLRHLFDLKPDSPSFHQQADLFRTGCKMVESIDSTPKRQQNRHNNEDTAPKSAAFSNEADTDFSLLQNLNWAAAIYDSLPSDPAPIPLVIDGEEIFSTPQVQGHSPNTNAPLGLIHLATHVEIEQAVSSAVNFFPTWSNTPLQERLQAIRKIAHLLRTHRAKLISVMINETGKILKEADTEVSEAIDFCEYYALNAEEWSRYNELTFTAIGPILVTPPWNFPCAIATGGVIAALVTGNTVIFKPAPEAANTGWLICQLIYEAGIPKQALQFVNCHDNPEGCQLIADTRIKATILTGATETAKKFLEINPQINLTAETGGKNCIIVTDMSDRDLAINDTIHSAFSHNGQKCSACSLLILEKAVYDDPKFLQALKDAAQSLAIGPSSSPQTSVNPLIHPPQGKLLKALTELENDETWLLKPAADPSNPHLWSPGIKLGVTADSFTFQNEFFGPLLGIVRAENLSEAITLANSLKYGLSGGLHSLDDREQTQWLENIKVGNTYINRGITGAIVNRQPFGGIKESAFGKGYKAGGPNYLLQFVNCQEKSLPENSSTELTPCLKIIESHIKELFPEHLQTWRQSTQSYLTDYNNYFLRQEDHSQLRGQSNYTIYRPRKLIRLFCQENDRTVDIYRCISAALICNSPLEIIATPSTSQKNKLYEIKEFAGIALCVTKEDAFPDFFCDSTEGYNRLIMGIPLAWLQTAAKKFTFVQANPVFAIGRLELLHYLRAISVSDNYHRYGNLGNKKTLKDFTNEIF